MTPELETTEQMMTLLLHATRELVLAMPGGMTAWREVGDQWAMALGNVCESAFHAGIAHCQVAALEELMKE